MSLNFDVHKGVSIYYVIQDRGEGSSRFITILHGGGSPQFITILHRGGSSKFIIVLQIGRNMKGLKSFSVLYMFFYKFGAKSTHFVLKNWKNVANMRF